MRRRPRRRSGARTPGSRRCRSPWRCSGRALNPDRPRPANFLAAGDARAAPGAHELAAAACGHPLGPPAADAGLFRRRGRTLGIRLRRRVAVPPDSRRPRATAVPDASQPERSMASHASLMIVDATRRRAFSPPTRPRPATPAKTRAAPAAKFKATARRRLTSTRRRGAEKRAARTPERIRAASRAHLSVRRGRTTVESAGWGRVAGARRDDRAPIWEAAGASPTAAKAGAQEAKQADGAAATGISLDLSQASWRDVVAVAAADAASPEHGPSAAAEPSSDGAGAPNPRRSVLHRGRRRGAFGTRRSARSRAERGGGGRRGRRWRRTRVAGRGQRAARSRRTTRRKSTRRKRATTTGGPSRPEEDSRKSAMERPEPRVRPNGAPRLRKRRSFSARVSSRRSLQGDEEEEEEAAEDDDSDEGSEEEDDEALEIWRERRRREAVDVGGTQAVPARRSPRGRGRRRAALADARSRTKEAMTMTKPTQARFRSAASSEARRRRALRADRRRPEAEGEDAEVEDGNRRRPARRGKMNPECERSAPATRVRSSPTRRTGASTAAASDAARTPSFARHPRARRLSQRARAELRAAGDGGGGRSRAFRRRVRKIRGAACRAREAEATARLHRGDALVPRRWLVQPRRRTARVRLVRARACDGRKASDDGAVSRGAHPGAGSGAPRMFEGTTLLSRIPSKEEVDELRSRRRAAAVTPVTCLPAPPPSALEVGGPVPALAGCRRDRGVRAVPEERTRVQTPSAGRIAIRARSAVVWAPRLSPDGSGHARTPARRWRSSSEAYSRRWRPRDAVRENARVFDDRWRRAATRFTRRSRCAARTPARRWWTRREIAARGARCPRARADATTSSCRRAGLRARWKRAARARSGWRERPRRQRASRAARAARVRWTRCSPTD